MEEIVVGNDAVVGKRLPYSNTSLNLRRLREPSSLPRAAGWNTALWPIRGSS